MGDMARKVVAWIVADLKRLNSAGIIILFVVGWTLGVWFYPFGFVLGWLCWSLIWAGLRWVWTRVRRARTKAAGR